MRGLLFGLLVSVFAGPLAFADAAPPPPGTPVTVTAGANDTSGESAVGAGGRLVVRLLESGGTGYGWGLMGDGAPELTLVGRHLERQPGGRLGAPQIAVFEFEAQGTGQKELTFGLFAPAAAEPAKTYVLTVTIVE